MTGHAYMHDCGCEQCSELRAESRRHYGHDEPDELETRFAKAAVNIDDDERVSIPDSRRDEMRLLVEAAENISGFRFGLDKHTGEVLTANDSEMIDVNPEEGTVTLKIKEDSRPPSEREIRRKVPDGWD